MNWGRGINVPALVGVDIVGFFYAFGATYGDSFPWSSPRWCLWISRCGVGEGNIHKIGIFYIVLSCYLLRKVKRIMRTTVNV